MDVTNPQEVLNNDQLPPELHEGVVAQNDQPYRGPGGCAPLGYVPVKLAMITPRLPLDLKEKLDEHVAKRKIGNCDYSMNKFIKEAIEEKITRDNETAAVPTRI